LALPLRPWSTSRVMFASRRLLLAASCAAALASGPFADAQAVKPQPAPPPGQRFAIPGSPDSASSGGKGPSQSDLGKKSKRRGRGAARADARPRPGASVATFPGFRMLPGGGSRIFVELTKSVNVDERRANGALVYTLRGAQVLSRNNKNALITTHFATPVARARLVPAGSDVDLVIDLRTGVEATHQVVAGENGTARLEIDFPPGDYPLAPGLFEPPAGASLRKGRGDRGSDEGESAAEPTAAEPAPKPARPAPTGTAPPGVGPPAP